MVTRELQVSQREKQEILAFEGHLAAASTKQTITESSSLLLSQLTSLEPQYALRGARAGPGLAGAGGGAASWPLSWFSAWLAMVKPRAPRGWAGRGGTAGLREDGQLPTGGRQAAPPSPGTVDWGAVCLRLRHAWVMWNFQRAAPEASPSRPGSGERPQPVPPPRAPAVSEPEPGLSPQHHPEAGESRCGPAEEAGAGGRAGNLLGASVRSGVR